MAHSPAAVPPGAPEQGCPIRVEHDRRRRQFTVRLNGCHDRAVLLYEYVGKRIVDLQHTEVPDAYRGRGIAKHLAKVVTHVPFPLRTCCRWRLGQGWSPDGLHDVHFNKRCDPVQLQDCFWKGRGTPPPPPPPPHPPRPCLCSTPMTVGLHPGWGGGPQV
ncbi:protein NATD1 isoform X1 [Sagmatias obliquidens]|uniref:protein NATD1 isoform X1 n=1 Tax=Sagmatias obliquidens TaxID=3371155 RepID=UPI000F444E41|nr:protein NATD1 isoform X1 [Lagenorhynchus obliquidens]